MGIWFKEEIWPIIGSMVLAVVGALAAYISLRVRKMLDQREKSLIKRQVVEDCVKAVEQVYSELDGPAKKAKAMQGIRELLEEKKVGITAFELDILIEACVKELNCGLFSGSRRLKDYIAPKI